MWRTHIEPAFGEWPVGRVRFNEVSAWVVSLNRVRSPATTRKAYRVLSLLLDWSVASGLTIRNEAAGVRLPRQTTHRAQATSAETIERLADAVRPPANDLVRFLAYTGLRWGEATALRVGDVDLRRRRMTVSRTHVEIHGRLETGTPKSHKSREVPIIESLVATVTERMAGRDRADLLFTKPRPPDSDWLRATAAAGIPGFRVHDLRHTAASLMIESGANVVDVSAVLGHANSHTTLTIYAHLIGARLDDVAAKFDATIASSRVQNAPKNPSASPQRPTTKRRK